MTDLIRIAICEDEQAQADHLAAMVADWARDRGHREAVSRHPSAESLLFALEDGPADILLLDIQMGGMDGMNLARELRRRGCGGQIVFVTGVAELAAEGYEVDAVHYLLKPVSAEKLGRVLDKALDRMADSGPSVILATREGSRRVALRDIAYAEAFSHVIELHEGGRVHRLGMAMGELEALLGDGFFRCHRSYLAGMAHVSGITRRSLLLDSGKELPLPRRLYEEANRRFIAFHYGKEAEEL